MNVTFDNPIAASLGASIRKRMNSSFYGTLILYWVMFHWNFIFTALFVSEDKIWTSTSLLKNEYLARYFFDTQNPLFYTLWVLPLILTFLTIWVFPRYLVIPAFEREETDEKNKELFILKNQREIAEEQTRLENEKVKKVTFEAEKFKEEQKAEENWRKEYRKFEKGPYYIKYLTFLDTYYQGNSYAQQFNAADISYFDALGLIDMNQNQITALTQKGKYFAQQLRETPG